MVNGKPDFQVRLAVWVCLGLLSVYVLGTVITGQKLPLDQGIIVMLCGIASTVVYSYYKNKSDDSEEEDPIILLVEDEHDQALSFQLQMRKEGISQVMVANSGEIALKMLRNEAPYGMLPRPKAILLDLGLPGMSGSAFNKIIKIDPSLCNIPVIPLTGTMRYNDVPENDMLQFCFAFIEKGRGSAAIARAIRAAVSGERPFIGFETNARIQLPWKKRYNEKALQRFVHDLRNNIAVIKGNIVFMEAKELNADQKGYMQSMSEECDKVLSELTRFLEEAFLDEDK